MYLFNNVYCSREYENGLEEDSTASSSAPSSPASASSSSDRSRPLFPSPSSEEVCAFACSRCTDDHRHQLVNEETYLHFIQTPCVSLKVRRYLLLCEKRNRNASVCDGYYFPTMYKGGRSCANSILSRELGKGISLPPVSDIAWQKFKTLGISFRPLRFFASKNEKHFSLLFVDTLDIFSWAYAAPWVIKSVPTSPHIVSVGTNRGTVELFDLSNKVEIQEYTRNWLADRVQSHHKETIVTTLEGTFSFGVFP